MLIYLINKYKNIVKSIVNKRNRRLILLSIFDKWNPIALDCNVDNGCYDCPLCKEYRENGCYRCPIQKRTRKSKCIDTPYIPFSSKSSQGLERCIYIEDEIEFLISLLDKETQDNLESVFIKWCKTGKL